MSQIRGYDHKNGGKIQVEFSCGTTIWMPVEEAEETAERVKLFVGKRDLFVEPGTSGYYIATPNGEFDAQPVFYDEKNDAVQHIGSSVWYDANEWKFIRKLSVV